jgi:hypothetical protein
VNGNIFRFEDLENTDMNDAPGKSSPKRHTNGGYIRTDLMIRFVGKGTPDSP